MTTMTIQEYTERRDQLLRLFADVQNRLAERCVGMTPDMGNAEAVRQEVDGLRKKVTEDTFRIALVSRFQGGKSTTFNAMCGGRFISPMGDGAVNCSASVITAINAPDADREGVVVEWRGPQELMARCRPVVGELADHLADPGGLAQARAAWRVEFAQWKADAPSWEEERRDELFTSGLILQFFDHPRIAEKRGEKFTPVSVGEIVRYPKDFRIRYAEGDPSVFQPEEAAFVFVGRVVCRVASPWLDRIGASITDCPGILANSYDTQTAMNVINTSDAIWYLLDGQEPQPEVVRLIGRYYQSSRESLFVSVNMKATNPARKYFVEKVIPPSAAKLRGAGMEIKDANIHLYHALLAFLGAAAQRAQGFLAETLDENSRAWLLALASDFKQEPVTDPEEAWTLVGTEMLHRLRVKAPYDEFLAQNGRVTDAAVQALLKSSCLDEITGAIEQYVVENKGRIVLGRKGALAAGRALRENLLEPLKTREMSCRTDREKWLALVAGAKDGIREFRTFAETELAPFTGDQAPFIDQSFADQCFFDVIFAHCGEIAEKTADGIAKQGKVSELLKTLAREEEESEKVAAQEDAAAPAEGNPVAGVVKGITDLFGKVMEGVTEGGKKALDKQARQAARKAKILDKLRSSSIHKAITDNTDNVLRPYVSSWLAHLSKGDNPVFQKRILVHAPLVQGHLKDKWVLLGLKNDIIKSLDAPVFGEEECRSLEAILEAVGRPESGALRQAGEERAKSGSVIAPERVIGLVLRALGPVAEHVLDTVADNLAASKRVDKVSLQAAVAKALTEGWNLHGQVLVGKRGGETADTLSAEMSVFRRLYVEAYRMKLERVSSRFEDAQRRREQHEVATEAERLVKAEQCLTLRTTVIEPLLKELEEFAASVTASASVGGAQA